MLKKVEPLLSSTELNKLPFLTSKKLLIKNEGSAEIVYGIPALQDKEKIEALLSGRASVSSLTKGMKAYIIPGSSLKIDDLKEVCKQKDLKITLNLSKADVIIGNGNILGSAGSSGTIARRFYLYRDYFDNCDSVDNQEFIDYCNNTWNIDISNIDTTIVFGPGTFQYRYPHFPVKAHNYYDTLVSDECAAVLYNVLSKKLPVVNDIELFKSIEKIPLDSSSYETLESMLNSSSTEDWAVAMQIIYNCDLDNSHFYLWKLTDKFWHKMNSKQFRNTKMYDVFNTIISEIRYLDHEEIMNHLADKLQLTKEIWDELIDQIISDNRDRCPNPTISAITIEVKMTQTYEEFIDQYVSKEEEHD